MKVWTVTSTENNETLDCTVYPTEQKALEGYLFAIGLGDDEEFWDQMVALYWKDAGAFDEKINDYLDEYYPGNMYRLYEHEIEEVPQ